MDPINLLLLHLFNEETFEDFIDDQSEIDILVSLCYIAYVLPSTEKLPSIHPSIIKSINKYNSIVFDSLRILLDGSVFNFTNSISSFITKEIINEFSPLESDINQDIILGLSGHEKDEEKFSVSFNFWKKRNEKFLGVRVETLPFFCFKYPYNTSNYIIQFYSGNSLYPIAESVNINPSGLMKYIKDFHKFLRKLVDMAKIFAETMDKDQHVVNLLTKIEQKFKYRIQESKNDYMKGDKSEDHIIDRKRKDKDPEDDRELKRRKIE